MYVKNSIYVFTYIQFKYETYRIEVNILINLLHTAVDRVGHARVELYRMSPIAISSRLSYKNAFMMV
jgi:hypothetical protein